MAGYSGAPTMNPYWYYDPHGYQPNVSVSFNTNISVNTPLHSSFDMYNTSYNSNNNTSSGFADSGYLSRTPTPPTPSCMSSPQPPASRQEVDEDEVEPRLAEKPVAEAKPRLPYVKRTRIQYTMQQLQILEEAFQRNHYPEVTTVDALADILDVRHEKISIWFQNRRSRFKRQQKPKSAASVQESTKKVTHAPAMTSVAPPPTHVHEPSGSYYPPYFWPSPIADSRATAYAFNPHSPSFYENAPNAMWNTSNAAYSSPSAWHHSMSSTGNTSLASPASPPLALLPEH